MRYVLLVGLVACDDAVVVQPSVPILFEEVTASAGINYTGETFGVSWGDVNNDGWYDLWIGNHRNPAQLYINNRVKLPRGALIGLSASFDGLFRPRLVTGLKPPNAYLLPLE